MMSPKLILLFATTMLIIKISYCDNSGYSSCITQDNIHICDLSLCLKVTLPCKPGTKLIPADRDTCNCCDRCVKCPEKEFKCVDGHEQDSCNAADCRPIEKCESGRFVKKDFSKCICCDTCVDDCA